MTDVMDLVINLHCSAIEFIMLVYYVKVYVNKEFGYQDSYLSVQQF